MIIKKGETYKIAVRAAKADYSEGVFHIFDITISDIEINVFSGSKWYDSAALVFNCNANGVHTAIGIRYRQEDDRYVCHDMKSLPDFVGWIKTGIDQYERVKKVPARFLVGAPVSREGD